ncbi:MULTISPECIES: invasion associated locus B family protein [unclassified Rhizobium]|nr:MULTISPECIES: invasion associated locus B family protein [unclassified Rhizobium]MBB3287013.1 invasion protein IalB [Rhizobium sp. BK252]MBB3401753.1 invasion protein IalB [Rhizobium sp. BK289]MBB3414303.1 invasion protein IalB [Rhizobium sp. BK284]MBB3482190.1 invasion protein IalB [Rhizobium sp. BK347]
MRQSWQSAIGCIAFLLLQAVAPSAFGGDNAAAPQSDPSKALETDKNNPAPVSPAPLAGSAAASPADPQVTEQKFDAWTLQCSTDKALKPPCQIMYRLTSPDQKQVFMVISMARSAENKVGMQMALPLGFSIQAGVKIGFGAKYSTMAKVSRCTNQGCLVEGLCPPGMLDALLKEKSGKVSIRMMQGNTAELPISLGGFSAAYRAMEANNG